MLGWENTLLFYYKSYRFQFLYFSDEPTDKALSLIYDLFYYLILLNKLPSIVWGKVNLDEYIINLVSVSLLKKKRPTTLPVEHHGCWFCIMLNIYYHTMNHLVGMINAISAQGSKQFRSTLNSRVDGWELCF